MSDEISRLLKLKNKLFDQFQIEENSRKRIEIQCLMAKIDVLIDEITKVVVSNFLVDRLLKEIKSEKGSLQDS